ncbi:DNA primase [Streptomyces caeruleatus]
MNRTGLGLAVGAGYLLGRTKKLKMAFAVGTLVAGKRMHLSPKAIADLVSQQLLKNPQFKEIGDTLREDLRGVGKAASGAMVERQINAIADRLHGRTAQVRDELSGVAPEVPGLTDDDEESEEDEEPSDEHEDDGDDEAEDEQDEAPARKTAKKAPAKKTAAKKQPGRKPPAKKTAQSQGRTAGKKTAAKKTTAKKTAAKKTAAARGAGRSTRSRLPKGGGE